MSFTESITDFFGDMGVVATIVTGTSTARSVVYFDTPSQTVLSGAALLDDPSITLPAFVNVARGSSVTIGTNAYTVRSVDKLDDGVIARALLESV